ncbi:hypothetical protein PENSPDRAFT_754919 [Peniophora sp. CONT]|nr:hypothetical protein PENSPDRAFT_754919 [Peniophora sp. CONT]
MHFAMSANSFRPIPTLCLRPEHTRAQAFNLPLPLGCVCCSSAHTSPASQFGSLHDHVRPLPHLSPQFPHSTLRPSSRCLHLRTHTYPARHRSASSSIRTGRRLCLRACVHGRACFRAPHRTQTNTSRSLCVHSALSAGDTWYGQRPWSAYSGALSKDSRYSTG